MVFVRNEIKLHDVRELVHANKLDDALNLVDAKLLEIFEVDEDPSRQSNLAYLYNMKSYVLSEMDNYAEAEKHIKHAIELEPTNDDFYNNQGILFYHSAKANIERKQELMTSSVDSFAKAIELQPSNANYSNNMGLLCYHLERFEESIKYIDHSISLNPENYQFYYNKALILYENKFARESLFYINKAIEYSEKQTGQALPNYFHFKGMVLYDEGRFEESLTNYDKAIAINNTKPEFFAERALCLFQLERSLNAIDDFDIAIKLQPHNTGNYYFKGLILFELQRYRECSLTLDRAIGLNYEIHNNQIHPKFNNPQSITECYYYKGLTLNMLGKYKESLTFFEKAIERTYLFKLPPNPQYFYNYAVILMKEKFLQKAIDVLQLGIEIDPNNDAFYDKQGVAYCLMSKYEEGINKFETALKLNPTKKDHYNNRIQLAQNEAAAKKSSLVKQIQAKSDEPRAPPNNPTPLPPFKTNTSTPDPANIFDHNKVSNNTVNDSIEQDDSNINNIIDTATSTTAQKVGQKTRKAPEKAPEKATEKIPQKATEKVVERRSYVYTSPRYTPHYTPSLSLYPLSNSSILTKLLIGGVVISLVATGVYYFTSKSSNAPSPRARYY